MMKKLLYYIAVIMLLTSIQCYSQWQNGLWTGKQAYNWYFGSQVGLNFNSSPPSMITGSMLTQEGIGGISDPEGNLLFYTNGLTVWNRNHEIMQNGTDLFGNESSSQNGLVVPVPGNPDKYLIFSVDGAVDDGTTTGLAYSEVDMTLDGGLGAVTANKNIVISTVAGEKITAVHHADGQQVWVVSHTGNADFPSNTFKAFLVSDEGVNVTPVESSVGQMINFSQAQMKISPDGSKIAVINFGAFQDFTSLQIFDFNSNTGQITNPVNLTSAINFLLVWGVEFSPNSNYLYTSEGGLFGAAKVLQFNLDAGDEQAIINSKVAVGEFGSDEEPSPDWLGSLQVAPDGKVYLAKNLQTTLGVINYPNNSGIAAGFVFEGTVAFPDVTYKNGFTEGGKSYNALPGFIQSYFESGILHEGIYCPESEIAFSTIRIPGIESIVWDFGDAASGADNASTDLEPVHAFSAPGTYTVTAVITSNGAQQTTTTEVIINPVPEAEIPAAGNIALCSDDSGDAIFNLATLSQEILNGQDPAVFTVTFYASEEDLVAGTSITAPENFSTAGQTVYARVTNAQTGCSVVIDFQLVVNPLPQATAPVVEAQCANAEGTASLDLTQQEATILGPQGSDDFTVEFYASDADMQAGTPITTPGSFTTSGQTVYARVTNNVTGCQASVAFDLPVTPLPVADNPEDVVACDSYELPLLSAGNSYWTGPGETGEEVPAGQIITETTTLYIVAHSTVNPVCTSENVFEVSIIKVSIGFEAGCDGTVYKLAAVPVDDSFNMDTATYAWTGNGITSAEREFAVPVAGVYTVTVTTAEGCTGEGTFEVEGTTCVIPRGISPNGDEYNNNFDLSDYDVKKLSIFNRYGMEVYSMNNYRDEWAGQGSNGDELPAGTYYYMVERTNGENKTGWVYLNREE